MKELALAQIHKALGARMAEFAGFNMPIYYTKGITEEHLKVRNKVGVFDVSHMGEFIIKGREALALIQSITTNDASRLSIGQAQYSCMPNEYGGIVDDLLVYRLDEDQCTDGEQAYMLVVNAGNIDKDWNWVLSHNNFDTRVINISDRTALLAIQGPLANQVLQSLTEVRLSDLEYYTFSKGRLAGIDNVLISATGYTGAGGYELYFDEQHAVSMWEAIFEAGKSYDIQPIGLGARDTLRLEKGYCLYGHDIDDTTSPLEAGLGWITKLNKGDFTSSEKFKEQKKAGVDKKLVGFKVDDRRVPRQHYPIWSMQNETIGEVTSGTVSPILSMPIGMGYVKTAFARPGTSIQIKAGEKLLAATVCELPFVK
ncbi:MAG: glycine cleavage system aminomethyltransferase GcvT [Saprospiraceae bacterium]|nr:glycine cleavage system aminomethyltransferase GcvT [Saprospiraceae bacterium]MBP8094139.1 glycine cleavage system aminomethyltransferase GcvT [Saprospiraceae bacterium]